jgi:hypothetical protein
MRTYELLETDVAMRHVDAEDTFWNVLILNFEPEILPGFLRAFSPFLENPTCYWLSSKSLVPHNKQ